MERLIFYIDVFLLTLAIGINVHRVEVWYNSPMSVEEAAEYERANIGRS
jgi:hypothetical protein